MARYKEQIIAAIKEGQRLTREEICNLDGGYYEFPIIDRKFLGYSSISSDLVTMEYIIMVEDEYYSYFVDENRNESIFEAQNLLKMKKVMKESYEYSD